MEYKYLFVVVDVVLKVGEEILFIYIDLVLDFEIEWKVDYFFLIIVDWKVYVIIVIILNEIFFFVLSEEGKYLEYDICCNWDVMWIVDLLDGMKEFIK